MVFAATAPPIWLKEKLPRLVCPHCAARQTAAATQPLQQDERQTEQISRGEEPAPLLPARWSEQTTGDGKET